MGSTLQIARDGALVTLTLNRPEKLNALNAELLGELDEAFASLVTDASIRCAILTGAGEKAFAAGADICTVLGTADIGTIKGGIKAADAFGKACQIDLINVADKLARTREIAALGAHIIGARASEIIHECSLALAADLDLEDLARTIHAHPTVIETISEAAEDAEQRAIHLIRPAGR